MPASHKKSKITPETPAEYQKHAHTHHPRDRHPLTVAQMSKILPVVAVVLGLTVGVGVLLVAQQQQLDMLAQLSPRHARVAQSDTVKTDLYEMKLGATRTVDTDPAFTPAPKDNLVIIPFSLTNRSRLPQQFFPSIHTFIRDKEGNTYEMHPTVYIQDPLPAIELAPGSNVRGELSYAVPKALEGFKFYVDPGWGDMAPVVFYINR